MGHGQAAPMRAAAGGPLKGRADVPGDKSISHRALILGALAVGETRITGLLGVPGPFFIHRVEPGKSSPGCRPNPAKAVFVQHPDRSKLKLALRLFLGFVKLKIIPIIPVQAIFHPKP